MKNIKDIIDSLNNPKRGEEIDVRLDRELSVDYMYDTEDSMFFDLIYKLKKGLNTRLKIRVCFYKKDVNINIREYNFQVNYEDDPLTLDLYNMLLKAQYNHNDSHPKEDIIRQNIIMRLL